METDARLQAISLHWPSKPYAEAFRGLGLHPQLTLNTWSNCKLGCDLRSGERQLSGMVNRPSPAKSSTVISHLPTLLHHFLGTICIAVSTRQVYTKAHRPVPAAWPDRAIVEKIHSKGSLSIFGRTLIVDDDRGRGATWRKVHFDVSAISET